MGHSFLWRLISYHPLSGASLWGQWIAKLMEKIRVPCNSYLRMASNKQLGRT